MPSLFTNEYSRGPLYQYWKERAAEENSLRDQRVSEAKIRSKGFTPLDAAYGPSSSESYASREVRGPPGYSTELDGGRMGSQQSGQSTSLARAGPDDLPAYQNTIPGASASRSGPSEDPSRLLSSEEEKSRLQQLEQQHRQTESDAAMARTLSSSESDPGAGSDSHLHQPHVIGGEGMVDESALNPDRQPPRKKSTAGKVGRWLADAATGYTKRQERW